MLQCLPIDVNCWVHLYRPVLRFWNIIQLTCATWVSCFVSVGKLSTNDQSSTALYQYHFLRFSYGFLVTGWWHGIWAFQYCIAVAFCRRNEIVWMINYFIKRWELQYIDFSCSHRIDNFCRKLWYLLFILSCLYATIASFLVSVNIDAFLSPKGMFDHWCIVSYQG